MKIGFIGLGIMGRPMAKNLLKAGYAVMVLGSSAAAEELAAAGAEVTDRETLGRSCDVVFTMVPNSPEVRKVMLGEDGIAGKMRRGSVYIDCSSINPLEARDIAARLGEMGISMLDAPVSGGEPKAIDGTLAFMVGGEEAVFEKCRPLFLAMGATAVLCGPAGAGDTAKLANQIIVACNIRAVAEALTFVQKAGADPALVYQAIRGGLAGSAVLDAKAPMMIAGDDKPGGKLRYHVKDLNNVLDCAHAVGASVPMTASVQEVFHWLEANRGPDIDHGAMVQYYEQLDNLLLGR